MASVPTPITEESSDVWFVWRAFITDITIISAIGAINGGTLFEFDSKAQRIMSADETMLVIIENASATAGLQYAVKFRMLIKKH